MAPEDAEYQRGRVDAELAEHANHLGRINGSIDRFAGELHNLVLAIQRLADAADADRSTVKTTAAALKEAEDARRDKSDAGWTPVQRLLALLAGLAAVATVAGIAWEVFHHLDMKGGAPLAVIDRGRP
jgi:DNA-binding IclR family transcriptional regulator